ncbi:thiolase family protein [Microbacterium aurantiacum]|uniref:Probable acetyl-CoA acetyltransferase n=1 Tax=Microbacterium aurantiacum TaxID=162393 RepID=A0AAJ2HB77_9MICO|nr:thiolase family protein [Microbacterium aurantiacum]MDS0244262.1 thiolase family protein [Microbacterium aurantiacum]
MTDAIVLVDGARTPVGSFGGAFASVPAHTLGALAVSAAVGRAGVDISEVDEFVLGCVGQVGPDAFIARRVALAAGAAESSTAFAVNRLCGSGLQAIATAADELNRGDSDIVVAGGVENMTRQPFLDYAARDGYRLGHRQQIDGTLSLVTDPWGDYPMGRTAENVAERYGISRAEQDAFAAESQRKARAAMESGAVAGEIVPVEVAQRRQTATVDTDEHPRETNLEALSRLRAAFSEQGTVTAGNSSGINDGAAAIVMMRASTAAERGLSVLGELVAFSKVGLAPEVMGYAPVAAIARVLERAGLGVSDIDWVELNEAFAAQAVAVQRDAGLIADRVNPLGGAIAWGHPVGATGSILALRALHGLRRTGGEHAMVSMCIGGGQGVAAVFRRSQA